MDESIAPERRRRRPAPAPEASWPRRGACFAGAGGLLLVSFDDAEDGWTLLPGRAAGELPAGLCSEVRDRLEALAERPLAAFRHPTEVDSDRLTLLIDDDVVTWEVSRGSFLVDDLVRWRSEVIRAVAGRSAG
jgi:hypothetical protein